MRFDVGRIDAGPTITPQGYLKAKGYATRTGVFYYMKPDGTVRRELRHPDDVFSEDSVKTLANVVVTNDHPPEPLTADNTKRYNCGFTGDTVQKVDEFLVPTLNLTESNCIKDVLDGFKQELSCGYFCDLDETPGVFNGEEYDVRQVNIRYNHLSVVQRGRAGPKAKIQMDSIPVSFRADSAMMVVEESSSNEIKNDVNFNKLPTKEQFMAKFKIDGIEYEVQDGALAQKVVQTIDALDSAKKTIEDSKKEIETLKAKADALDSELKKADEKVKELENKKLSDQEIRARADEINKVLELGKKVLGKDFKDDMAIEDVKKAVVTKELSGLKLDGKDQAYFDAAFDVIYKRSEKAGSNALADALSHKTDSQVSDSAAAKKKREEEYKNAWKK